MCVHVCMCVDLCVCVGVSVGVDVFMCVCVCGVCLYVWASVYVCVNKYSIYAVVLLYHTTAPRYICCTFSEGGLK